jgi:phosphoribosyl-dephospho-CoA transferase
MKAKTAFIAGDVVDQAIQRAKIAGEEKWFETLRTHKEWATGEQKWMVLEGQAARIKKLYAELEEGK